MSGQLCERCHQREDACVCPEGRYRREMGKEPPALPEEDPLAWQWDTSLTRRQIRERIGLAPREETREEPPPLIDGQESLL